MKINLRKSIISLALVCGIILDSFAGTGFVSVNAYADEISEFSAEQELPVGGIEKGKAEFISSKEAALFEAPVLYSSRSVDTFYTKAAGTYGYDRLSAGQQSFYNEIDEQMELVMTSSQDFDSSTRLEVYFEDDGLTTTEACAAWVTYLNDHPAYYWIQSSVWLALNTMYIAVRDEYSTADSRNQMNSLIESGVTAIAAKAQKYSDKYEQVRVVHDEIIDMVDYAYDSSGKPENSYWAHSVIGVFDGVHNGVVCEGYARAFSLVLNYLGIQQAYIVSKDHAYNLVDWDSDGVYYYYDLTWDDIDKNLISYTYFGVPKSNFESVTSHKAVFGTGMAWQPSLPTIGSGMDETYAKHYLAYADSNITDAESFVNTAGMNAPGKTLYILGERSAISSLCRVTKTGYYICNKVYDGLYYILTESYPYKIQSPATSFVLDKSTVEVDKSNASTITLTVNSVNPTSNDDYIRFSSSNTGVAEIDNPLVKASSGNSVTVKLNRRGTATITAASVGGKYSQTCTVTVTSSSVSDRLFTDAAHTELLAADENVIFTSGAKYTDKATKAVTNYKALTLYSDIAIPTYTDSKGKVKTGKILVTVSETAELPEFTKGKFAVSKTASAIAKPSYKKKDNSVTVTAGKNAGTVYVWIASIGAGNQIVEYGYAEVTVKSGASKIVLKDSDYTSESANTVKAGTVAVGESATFYAVPTFDKLGTIAADCHYTVTPAAKLADCVSVEQLDKYGFKVTAKGLYNGKQTKVKLDVTCVETKKKASFTLTIINPANNYTFASDDSAVTLSSLTKLDLSGTGVGIDASYYQPVKVTITDSTKAVKTVIAMSMTLADSSFATTDKPKVYMMSSQDGFTVDSKGRVKITAKPTGDNAKIKAKYSKGNIEISVPKGLSASASTYALIVSNTYSDNGFIVMPIELANS